MRRFQFSLLAVWLLASFVGFADPVTSFTIDFEDTASFTATSCAERGGVPGGRWRRLSSPGSDIRVFEDQVHHQALQLTRQPRNFAAIFNPVRPLPTGNDYVVGADFYLESGDAIYLHARDKEGKFLSGFSIGANSALKVLHRGASSLCDLTVPIGWCRLEIHCSPSQRVYTVRLIKPDGTTKDSTPCVLAEGTSDFADIMVGTLPPEGRKGVIDNISLKYERLLGTAGRTNVAATADIQGITFPYEFTAETDVAFTAKLADLADISSIEVFGSAGLKCRAEGVNAGGQRVQLATPISFIRKEKEKSQQADFQASIYGTVRFSISGHPGETIQRVAIYAPPDVSQVAEDERFGNVVIGDFALPVYEGDGDAELHLFNRTTDPIKVKVAMLERTTGKAMGVAVERQLAPGKNVLPIPLKGLAEGDYFAKVTEQTADGKDGGMLKRLLRRQIAPVAVPPPVAKFAPAQKIYFPDGYYLAESANLAFRQGQARGIQVTKSSDDLNAIMQHGETIYLHDGKVCIGFFTIDGNFRENTRKRYLATADVNELEHWTIKPVAKDFQHPEPPSNIMHKDVTRQDNAAKPGPDGKIAYRYYDAAVDGPVQINQLAMYYVGTARPGEIGYQAPPVLEGHPLSQRTTWAVWHKAPGLSLVLSRKPFLVDGYPGDFEEGNEANDNFVGSYLSDDGKTFFYLRGCLLRRYDPFNVPYENFARFGRFVTLFATEDGIHFQRKRISLPEPGDPIGTQHYGGYVFRLPYGNGLRIGYMLRYFIHEQRFAIDLNFSQDGFCWKRFPGAKLFLDNGPLGSWNAGSMQLSRFAVNANGQTVHLINWAGSGYHFYPGRDGIAGIRSETAESVQKRLEPRKVEEWPMFKQLGSYEKLAENIRNTRINVGIMVFRQDGFFYAEAGSIPATFTTIPISAPNAKLTVNAKIADGGNLKIQICRLDGTPIAGASAEFPAGDYMNGDTGLTAPEELFKIEVQMKEASLYTIGF